MLTATQSIHNKRTRSHLGKVADQGLSRFLDAENAVLQLVSLSIRCGITSSGKMRPCKRLLISIKCSAPVCILPGTPWEICCFWDPPVQGKRALSKLRPRFCSETATR